MSYHDTIAAPATPPGKGGVGIIRVSGNKVKALAKDFLGSTPQPRQAQFHVFRDTDQSAIDMGLVLFFPGPHSFTGEDVIEFHGHGGPVVIDRLLKRILSFNVRLAKPGEFSERAFLNDKIDLTQAEAIADLIDSSSEQAARSAMRSLQGEFSRRITHTVEQVVQLRMYVEAAIDFPEEEIDFLSDGKIAADLEAIINEVNSIQQTAKQGAILKEGMTVVIAGHPNAGKSTLLNALSGRESAIVTDVPGTTRDIMREHILIDGFPLHIIDTAGIRESNDQVEREGIRRAWHEIKNADRLLVIIDADQFAELNTIIKTFKETITTSLPMTILVNKMDQVTIDTSQKEYDSIPLLYISAKHEQGIEQLREHLKTCIGYSPAPGFLARRRHLNAIEEAQQHLLKGQQQLQVGAGELLAEELRLVQQALNEITGEFTSDDLLGKIFSSFCLGK